MRTFDPTPLWRSTIGFDRLFDLLNTSGQWTTEDNYPPYNIERTGEDRYQISLALAGFTADEVTITAEQNVLTVEGAKSQKSEHQYLYQGISGFRGSDVAPFGTADRFIDRGIGWPNVEVSETNDEVKVTAELQGLDEKDVEVQLANGVLTIRGEKKTETGDKDRLQRALLWAFRAADSHR